MPIINGAYVSPNWVNGGAPAIDQTELRAMSNTIALVPVLNGGTGRNTLASGSVLVGKGTASVGELSGRGALYASAEGAPTFGTLPVAFGGTGVTTYALLRSAIGLGDTTGTLSISYGGTGVTSYAALRNAMGLGNSTGTLAVANGGTGATSLSSLRGSMGLGNSTGVLAIDNGGTGASTAAGVRSNIGVYQTKVVQGVPSSTEANTIYLVY